jgi:hypothetical protein
MSIKYNLICIEEQHKFEGWFPSIEEFENQLANGKLVCPICDSRVRRDVMAPAIKKKTRKKSKKEEMNLHGENFTMGGRARTLLKQIQKHVEKNYENVGNNFAKEARKAHKGQRDEEFYGTPSEKEAQQLINEGIDLFSVPKIKDN